MAGEGLAFWQTLVAGALGGGLTLAGQAITKRMETRAESEARDLGRAEAVYDRRLQYELQRLEELRHALVRASAVADEGRRARRWRGNPNGVMPRSILDEVLGPPDPRAADEYQEQMSALRAAIAVTLDTTVRLKADLAFDFLASGDAETESPVEEALSALGERLRSIQGKVS